MQEQNPNTQPPAPTLVVAPTPRRTWERPVLQRLHVSLDTAGKAGSNADGTRGSAGG